MADPVIYKHWFIVWSNENIAGLEILVWKIRGSKYCVKIMHSLCDSSYTHTHTHPDATHTH